MLEIYFSNFEIYNALFILSPFCTINHYNLLFLADILCVWFFFFFFGGIGVWTQGLVLAKQLDQ
jgi:hypothetical protein